MAAITDKHTLDEETMGMAGGPARKFLVFALGDEQYGLPVHEVREIIRMTNVTRVPGAPAFIRGVMNLRGKVVPVMDLRKRLGFPAADGTDRTCIIVVQIPIRGQEVMSGFLVDGVAEVLDLLTSQIEDAPSFGGRDAETEMFLGIGKIRHRVILLLDTERILSPAEVAFAQQVTKESRPGRSGAGIGTDGILARSSMGTERREG